MVFDKIRINENSIYIGEGFFCYFCVSTCVLLGPKIQK